MIDFGFNDISNLLKSELLEKLKKSNPYYFEKIILRLFQKMGYGDFEETPKSGDGGIDGIINQDALGIERIYTQAKRYTSNNVGERDIRNFIGAMSGDVAKGIFVTTSDFDRAAYSKVRDARNHKIILINGNKLVELMIKYNLGVQEKSKYLVKEVDEDFFLED
jgi:restriction system protein